MRTEYELELIRRTEGLQCFGHEKSVGRFVDDICITLGRFVDDGWTAFRRFLELLDDFCCFVCFRLIEF